MIYKHDINWGHRIAWDFIFWFSGLAEWIKCTVRAHSGDLVLAEVWQRFKTALFAERSESLFGFQQTMSDRVGPKKVKTLNPKM